MKRFSQFGLCVLAILLIAAVAQCAVMCQTTPIQTAKSEANLPPCHKHSKSAPSTSDCSHAQTALLAAAANFLFDWTDAAPRPATIFNLTETNSLVSHLDAGLVDSSPAPPLCLRV